MQRLAKILVIVLLLFVVACENGERPTWGLPAEMFSNLPGPPLDWQEVSRQIIVSDQKLYELDAAYWKQPEFFPGFIDQGTKLLREAPKDRWGAAGIMGYPHTKKLKMVPGEQKNVTFFLRSSYLVQTYQGVRIVPRINAEEGHAQHLAIDMPHDSFVLGPSYPVFNNNWTHKIGFSVTLAQEAQKGTYEVVMDLANPHEEDIRSYKSQYGGLYYDAALVGVHSAYYTLEIEVV